MVLPIVGQRLVELAILVLRNVLWVSGPKRLGLVQLLLVLVLLLDLLLLLLVLVALFVAFFVGLVLI